MSKRFYLSRMIGSGTALNPRRPEVIDDASVKKTTVIHKGSQPWALVGVESDDFTTIDAKEGNIDLGALSGPAKPVADATTLKRLLQAYGEDLDPADTNLRLLARRLLAKIEPQARLEDIF